MDATKATQELTVIRQLMERPIRFSTMSGLAAIQAGIWALLGVAADGWAWSRCTTYTDALLCSMAVWGGVLGLSLVGVIALTRRRERQQTMPWWSPVKRRILLTILPPFVAAIGLTFAICLRAMHGDSDPDILPWQFAGHLAQGQLIPAIWMLFYGVTLWQLGQFSPVDVRVLGAAFIAAGLATAALWQWQPYWAMAATFGGLHIVYGAVVWVRHGG